jgi:hypothetical protein
VNVFPWSTADLSILAVSIFLVCPLLRLLWLWSDLCKLVNDRGILINDVCRTVVVRGSTSRPFALGSTLGLFDLWNVHSLCRSPNLVELLIESLDIGVKGKIRDFGKVTCLWRGWWMGLFVDWLFVSRT